MEWDKIYQKWMDVFRNWLTENKENALQSLNERIFAEDWEKYAKGTISAWEMEALCFYYHEHELKHVNRMIYDIKDFNKLPEKPIVARKIPTKDGKEIELLELAHICGTVLDKNKMKNSISLLTPTGVVTVKIYGDAFTHYDKQISERGADGKKHVIEKSWFSRGNKIIVTGIKQEDGLRIFGFTNDEITEENGFADIDCAEGEGRDG